MLSDKYKFINKIGSGSFGEVYLAEDKNKKQYAIKFEEKSSHSRLKDEYQIYKKLEEFGITTGIPKIFNFLQTPTYHVMVMQLHGDSLDNLFSDNNQNFDTNTVLKLGINITGLLENIHRAGFVHRDIKPNNFLIGCEGDKSNIYIMDFGLSKQYKKNNSHISLKVERSPIGTARYASINVHMGLEPSRRDDLESVGYMLVYFLKKKLPWQGLKKKTNSKADQWELIRDSKMSTSVKKLCEGLPTCFEKYINYCKELSFKSEPDYEYLKNLFNIHANQIELKYLWE